MRSLALLALAACGGTSPAPVRDDRPPEPLEAIDQLELRAERACHCTDDGCRTAVRDTLHALDDVTFDATERVRSAQTMLISCLGPMLDDELDAAARTLERFYGRACSHDHAEEREVARELKAWLERTDTATDALLGAHPTLRDYRRGLDDCLPQDPAF